MFREQLLYVKVNFTLLLHVHSCNLLRFKHQLGHHCKQMACTIPIVWLVTPSEAPIVFMYLKAILLDAITLTRW